MKNFSKIIFLILIFNNILADNKKETFEFYFKDKKLIDLVDFISKKKKINYIIPQNKSQQDEFKSINISYEPVGSKEVDLEKAWQLVTLFLELSGYSWFEKEKDLYQISQVGSKEAKVGVFREPLPLYINTKVEDLPKDDSRIRYVYYLTNLKISGDSPQAKDDPILRIIQDMSSKGSPDPLILTKANGFILIDKASVISSIINLISKLDETGFRETIQVVPLFNVNATDVSKVFENFKKAAGQEKSSPFIRADDKASISFFASDTQIVADSRNNSVILMGRESAVERIKEFVQNHVDTLEESGKSILHYYDLQYLDATSFAPVLKSIIAQESIKSQGKEGPAASVNKKFREVQIVPEQAFKVEPLKSTFDTETTRTPDDLKVDARGLTPSFLTGGNRLIIAAMQDDWQEIKKLIQRLDQPRPQVILEVLVADISHTKDKIIAGDIRSRRMDELINGVNFLASNIGPVDSVAPADIKTLAIDLLGRPLETTVDKASVTTRVTTSVFPGSLLLSFSDPTTPADGYSPDTLTNKNGGVWALINVLDKYLDVRIMTHPFLITFTNTKATVNQATIKRQRGNADPTQSGVIAVGIDNIPASIQLQMYPRVSSEKRLNLQVAVDITDFIASDSLTREKRRVETLVNLNSGDILIMGGLTKVTETDVVSETPFFGQIPIIGRFFQGISKRLVTSNLALFISPTIVMPRFRSGLHLHTKDKIKDIRADFTASEIYGDNRDPITYFFLPNKNLNNNIINEYLDQTTNESQYQKEETLDIIKREEEKQKLDKVKENLEKEENVENKGPAKLEDLKEDNSLDVPV